MARRDLLLLLAPVAAGAVCLAAPPRPDLIVDQPTMAATVRMVSRWFPPGDCTINEGCVAAPGQRRLLMFATQTANIGSRELVIGDPNGNPLFEYDTCHGHDHFLDYADYKLLDGAGAVVSPGHKQAFCVADGFLYRDLPGSPPEGVYDCLYQGLSVGWADTYSAETYCQWIDITDVTPGDYALSVTVNPLQVLEESSYANNEVLQPVTLHSPDDPDLTIRLTDVEIRNWQLDPSACSGVLGCVSGTGARRLLAFSTTVANVGAVDVFFGYHFEHPAVVSDACHNHWHVADIVKYELLDAQGNAVIPPVVRGLSFQDGAREVLQPWSRADPYYTGSNGARQGLQAGWATREASSAPCQWLDVTGLPDGIYFLRATADPGGILPEDNELNNGFTVPVSLMDPGGVPHVADGHFVPGAPLTVEAVPGGLALTWQPADCAAAYNLLHGMPGTTFSYTYGGAICGLDTSGLDSVALPDPPPGTFVWFNVVGAAGGTEGGHGFGSAGQARPLSGTGFCSITETRPSLSCPL